MTLIPSKFLVCVLLILVLISFRPSIAQTPALDSTIIPGIVEPLELTGDPQAIAQPSEVQKRLVNIFPKGEDPEDLRKAKETLDTIVKEYPDSAEALSTRVLLLCESKLKEAPNTNDIDKILRLQKAAGDKEKGFVLQRESLSRFQRLSQMRWPRVPASNFHSGRARASARV